MIFSECNKMSFINVYCCLLLIVLSYVVCDPDLIVKTENGLVQGTILNNPRANKDFYGFFSIPYAKAPLGNLRFKDPQPAENWNGVRNASVERAICPQIDIASGKFVGNEDCLFLNVFTPAVLPSGNCSNQLKPVLFWIHGGSFSFGSGNFEVTGFDYIVTQDCGVVVVTLNYRLNILGFLALYNEEVPGNAGLKDQLLALKWVKRNIAYFGGDPNKVTIGGESAGAVCVHFHVLSPMSKGLFHQAISESGSVMSPWAFSESTETSAFLVGKKLGYDKKDKEELFKILRNTSTQKLVTTTNEFYDWENSAKISIPFTPTLERNSSAEKIIADSPANLLKSGHYNDVPYIIGFNSAEGIIFSKGIKKIANHNIEETISSYSSKEIGTSNNSCKPKEVAGTIKDFYFSPRSNLRMREVSYINLGTDIYFFNGLLCSVRKMVPHLKSSLYMYEFSFTGSNKMYKKLFDGEEFSGAAHVEELLYLQRQQFDYPPNSKELLTSKRLNRLWGNFIKTGNPTPENEPLLEDVIWPPVSKMDIVYLNIGDDLSVQHNPRKKYAEFWSQLYKNFTCSTIC